MVLKFFMFAGITLVQALEAFIFIRGLKLPARFVLPVIAVFAVFNLGVIYLLWLQTGCRQPPAWAAAWIARPLFAWQFSWLTFVVFIGPAIGIVRVASSIGGWESPVTWLRWVILSIMGLWTALTIYGLARAADKPEAVTVEITLPGLPPSEDGLRVVQLTDTHVAWWNSREEFANAAAIVESMKPDLLAVTGDMVDHNPDYVHTFADLLENVKPRLGRFAIIGNHDVYTGREAVARRMEERGFKMLRNEWVSLADKGSSLILAGVDDSGRNWTGPDPSNALIPKALKDCPAGHPVILLKHRPFDTRPFAALPFRLVLAGHTHGGQICLPWGGPGLAHLKWKEVAGLYREGEIQEYVSRGTGTVGWPFRLFCPAEVTLIILRAPAD